MQFENLSYTLLSAKNPHENDLNLHNQSYKFWKNLWYSVLSKLNIDALNINNDFLRQDIIAVIHDEYEIAAIHLYSHYSLRSFANSEGSYFLQNLQKTYVDKLIKLGANNVMTMEYMTVNVNWRKHQHENNIHVGAILGGLALKVLQSIGADAAIAPARRDLKVHELAYIYGGTCIAENITNHNIPCDLIACFAEKTNPHPDIRVNQIVSKLWSEKSDNSATTEKIIHKQQNQMRKVA